MSTRAFSLFLIVSGLLALAACGSSGTRVCSQAGGCCVGEVACAEPQFLYANTVNSEIAIFPVSSGGALGTATTTPSAAPSLGMVPLNNQFLFASNPAPLSGGTINAWTINAGTGALTALPSFSLGLFSFAGGLAANPNMQMLYVADAGRIDALKIDATGGLSALPNSPFTSGTNLFLAVDRLHNFLFANDDDPPGSVFAFTIDSTGALTAVPNSPFPATTNLGVNSRPAEIVVDATGSFVYTPLTATGQVAGFSIGANGALTPVPGSPFTAGTMPLSIATTGSFVYVGNDGSVTGYSITAGSGMLTPLPTSPFAFSSGALAINSSGSILYASTAAGVLAFTINPQTGALTSIMGSPFPGPAATVLAFIP